MFTKAAGAVVACLMLVGCSAPAASPPSKTPGGSSSSGSSGSSSDPTSPSATAPGSPPYQVVRTTVSQPSKDAVYPVALGVDGSALVVHSQPHGDAIPKQLLEYRDADWNRVAVPRLAGASSRQIVSGAIGSRFAVWKETESRDLATDQWSIYSFDLQTHRVRLVARQEAAAPDGNAYAAPGGTTPTVDQGGLVYFSAVDYSNPARGQVRVFRADAGKAMSAEALAPGLAGQVRGRFVFSVEEGHGFRVVRRDAAFEHPTVLYRSRTDPSCGKISALVGNENGDAAVQLDCHGKARIGLLENGRLSEQTRVESPHAGYLALTDSFLWYASAAASGYRQHLNVLGTSGYVPVGQGSVIGECVCAGSFFSWAQFKGADAVRFYARLTG